MARKSELSKNNNDFYKIWSVLPVQKIVEQITLINKYFDLDSGDHRHHEHNTRTNLNVPLVVPVGPNKYHERTWKKNSSTCATKLCHQIMNYDFLIVKKVINTQ
jgi:hypothetical protein